MLVPIPSEEKSTIATNKYVDDKDLDADYEANKHPLLLLAKQNEDK